MYPTTSDVDLQKPFRINEEYSTAGNREAIRIHENYAKSVLCLTWENGKLIPRRAKRRMKRGSEIVNGQDKLIH